MEELMEELLQTPWNHSYEIASQVDRQKKNVVVILSYDQFPFMEGVTLTVRWDQDERILDSGSMTAYGMTLNVHPFVFAKMVGEIYGYDQACIMLRKMVQSHPTNRVQAAIDAMDSLKWLTNALIDKMFDNARKQAGLYRAVELFKKTGVAFIDRQ